MHRPRLGHAVIVNNVSSEMPGSKADVTALKAAYEAVGFDVQIHTDCNGQVKPPFKKKIFNIGNFKLQSRCKAVVSLKMNQKYRRDIIQI